MKFPGWSFVFSAINSLTKRQRESAGKWIAKVLSMRKAMRGDAPQPKLEISDFFRKTYRIISLSEGTGGHQAIADHFGNFVAVPDFLHDPSTQQWLRIEDVELACVSIAINKVLGENLSSEQYEIAERHFERIVGDDRRLAKGRIEAIVDAMVAGYYTSIERENNDAVAAMIKAMGSKILNQMQSKQDSTPLAIARMDISPRGNLNGLSFGDDKYLPDSSFSFHLSFHASCAGSSIKLLGFGVDYYADGLICAGGDPSIKIDSASVEIDHDGTNFTRPILIENGSSLAYSRRRCYPPLTGDVAGECDHGDIEVSYSYIADGLLCKVECTSHFRLQKDGQLTEIDRIRDVPKLTDDHLAHAVEEGRIDRDKADILLRYSSSARYRAARSNNSSSNYAGISDAHRAWLKTLYRGDSV